MELTWPDAYPSRDALKREVDAMVRAFSETLLAEISPERVAGIYHKGSAHKAWESLVDYVPEISDVDIHLLFGDGEGVGDCLGTVSQALRIQEKAEERFLSQIEHPLHMPRPQLVIMNRLLEMPDFVPSPAHTVAVVHGKPYPETDFGDGEAIRVVDAEHLIEDAQYLSAFPLHLVDRPGRYLWESVRTLVWRVSPIGPRVLHLGGLDTEQAWSLNRTRLVHLLVELGHEGLAEDYAGFYLNGWDYFLSGFADTDAGRRTLEHGTRALARAGEIARSAQQARK